MRFQLPHKVVKSGQTQNVLDPIYTLMKTLLNIRC